MTSNIDRQRCDPHAGETDPFAGTIDLAQPRLGARVVEVSDEWFGPGERMLGPGAPVFVEGRFDEHGKWMDGWETRRRRDAGNDYAIVRLGLAGSVRGFDIDTRHFTGNFPPAASIDGCCCPSGEPTANAAWTPLLGLTELRPNDHNLHRAMGQDTVTHVRLNIFPDGGIARLRVYGRPERDWSRVAAGEEVDLLAVENGGRAIACNDQHFGSIANLNMPGRGVDMGDGWETRRRREPGYDWVILALGHPGRIKAVEVDTAHFKGNYPDRCSLHAARVGADAAQSLVAGSQFWAELLPPQKLQMDAVHRFRSEVRDLGPVTHVRFNIHPDGGVSRLRLYGTIFTGELP